MRETLLTVNSGVVANLGDAGWDVTYLDVRKPPESIRQFVAGDATELPFPPESFDAVSSTCVLCHAGMGRYGDPIVEDGDELMIREIARVLKNGGRAALTFGPVTSAVDYVLRVEHQHRVYTLKEAERMARNAELRVSVPFNTLTDAYYLSMCLEK